MLKRNKIIISNNIIFLLLLMIITVSVKAEGDIYVQFFSNILQNLNVDGSSGNYIFRFYLAGSLLLAIMIGPFADTYNKRTIFIFGLVFYTIISFSCLYFINHNFKILLIARFLQGMAQGVITVVGWLLLFDNFSIIESGKMSGLVKGTSALLLAFTPLFSLWISNLYGWHSSFSITPILAIIALIISIFFLPKSPPKDNKTGFRLSKILKDYLKVLKNFECFTYILISAFVSSTYIVFLSNASIIFISNNYITKENFSYFITANSLTYIIASFCSIYIIDKKGIDFTKNIGFIVFITGSSSLFISSILDAENIIAILSSFIVMSIGSALMTGFILKAVHVFPEMKGISMSVHYIFTAIISARKLLWSQVFFNSKITPTTTIIFCGTLIISTLFIAVQYNKSKTS